MVQVQSLHEKIRDDLELMAKPLARHRDDEDLERLLKEREREGDPMLAYLRKKNSAADSTTGKKKKSMFANSKDTDWLFYCLSLVSRSSANV